VQIDNRKYSLDKATVVLFHPVAHTRSMLRSVVMGLGFTQVNDFSELRPARNAIVDRGADLVLLDIDIDDIYALERNSIGACDHPLLPRFAPVRGGSILAAGSRQVELGRVAARQREAGGGAVDTGPAT
jgi:hypothetical protein